MASGRSHVGSRHGKQPEHKPSATAILVANANAASAASKGGKCSRSCLPGSDPLALATAEATAEELLEQCKCPISLELMRRPVLPSSGQAFDEINLRRWSISGNTKCPVSGQELRMHKDKVQYTRHHLLRNIIRQQAAKAKIYIPPTDKDQLLLELQKPACTAKALQALFDDRCLSYIKKEAIMEVLKDLVKTNKANSKAHSKGGQDAKGKPFNLLQMIIRCCLAARKDDLIKYGRKLLRSEVDLWRDPEIIAEVLGLAEDTEHRGNILSDIESRFTEKKVGPKEFVKAVLRHHSDKNPVQRCLDLAANEVLAFRADAFDASEWSGEDKGEALNMALAAVHLQCIDAGVCYAQTGIGVARWTKALGDLQGLGLRLDRSNMEALFRSAVHAPALQQITSSSARAVLEWHMDQHETSLVGMLCLDHISLPPQAHHRLLASHFDLAPQEPSSDEDMEDDEDLEDELVNAMQPVFRNAYDMPMRLNHLPRGAILGQREEADASLDEGEEDDSALPGAQADAALLAELEGRVTDAHTFRESQRRRLQ
ncbi:hypothetical protein ABBQ38_010561 [Trebouxia sp. C0009 RCD-2024]